MDKYTYFYPTCRKVKEKLAFYLNGNLDMHPSLKAIYENIIDYVEGPMIEDKEGDSAPDSTVLKRARKLVNFATDLYNLVLGSSAHEEHVAYLQGELLKLWFTLKDLSGYENNRQ